MINRLRSCIYLGKIFVTLIFPFLFQVGCVRYASPDEMNYLEEKRKAVKELEVEVKMLKERQIELTNKKYELIREFEECQKSSAITDTSQIY